MKRILILGSGLLAINAHADLFKDKCTDLHACAQAVSELTGEKYIYDSEVKGQIYSTPNVELTKENALMLFTTALHMNGFTRMATKELGTYQILKERDARDSAIPTVSCDATHAPQLPEYWDTYTLKYKATNPEVVEEIARTIRAFMPVSSRVIPSELGGMILLTAAAPDLKRIYELIRENDQKPTAHMKEKLAQDVRIKNLAKEPAKNK